MRFAATLVLGLFATASGAAADSPAKGVAPASLVVIDLRQPGSGAVQGSESFAFSNEVLIGELSKLIERAIDTKAPIADRVEAMAETGAKAREHAKDSALRAVSQEGEVVRVAVLFDATLTNDGDHWQVEGRRPALSFDEQPRASRLATDLGTLVQLGAVLVSRSASRGATTMPVAWLIVQDYRLRAERATLAVTASVGDEAVTIASGVEVPTGRAAEAAAAPAAAREAPAPDKKESLKLALVTGPREHWFLSADVPLTKASQLKRNEQTGVLELANEPSAFYIGLNFLLGDLLAARQSVADVIAIKLMVKASGDPLDSLGVALGLRGRHLRKYGLDFDLISPFVGYTFTQEDEATASGEIVTDGSRNHELRFGVGLNLDKALGWVKGK